MTEVIPDWAVGELLFRDIAPDQRIFCVVQQAQPLAILNMGGELIPNQSRVDLERAGWSMAAKPLAPAYVTITALIQDRARQKERLTDVLDRVREIQREVQQHKDELAKFKTSVRDKAMELANEHGWCDTVFEALRDLGVPTRGKHRVRAIVYVDVFTESKSVDSDEIRSAIDTDYDYDLDSWSITGTTWEADD